MAAKTTTRNMTSGPIVMQLILFSLPLMLGNVFQMLYNTVDSIVVGRYVSTQALAAVGSTNMIINMLVFFFNGFATGAGVVIARYFGARDAKGLHRAVETTVAVTLILCAAFTVIGIAAVKPMLRLMATPDDVFDDAVTYLRIYFAGITTLLIYNIGSGILRAVGDTVRPLAFLMLTSLLNIGLDLLFVRVFGMKIEGVAWATVLSQAISAVLTMLLLTNTKDIYRVTLHDLRVDRHELKSIVLVGLPAGIQSVITAFSNVFVQSYVNYFESAAMAGWSCYNKLDQFIMLPMQSMALASTTFVSQNIGARKLRRADLGTFISAGMTMAITAVAATVLVIIAEPAISLFTEDAEVIRFGALFIRTNVFFLLFNCVNHVLAGSLRGRGDSIAPMIIMLSTFVGARQLYLFVMTHYISNTPTSVCLGYPVGWVLCFVTEVTYYLIKRQRYSPDGTARKSIA